jgi:hypothetical protein
MVARRLDATRSEIGRGKLARTASSIAVLLIIMLIAKCLGRHAGRHAAIHSVQQESISQNAPSGFMGAQWLTSIADAKRLFPDAIEFAPGNLKFETTAFSRPAFVDLLFDNNLLIVFIITFKGEKTESTYRQTHSLLVQEYGAFPEPMSTSEQKLVSKKRIGRVMIEHLLYQQLGMDIEQVMVYRTKDSLYESQ